MTKRIDQANVDWGKDNAPRSIFFNDIYFSGDGPAETAHVFLNGNSLPDRFRGAQRFSIGELGFGAGLNFLVAWDAWAQAAKSAGARLHFLSVEKYPLSTNDLVRTHSAWPALAPLAKQLRTNLPPPHPGLHQVSFDGGIVLTLAYGDALEQLSQIGADIDAWFLDGFAPAKNPEMWSPELFAEIARLSAPGATAATFTVAGAVRRSLQNAGFEIEKAPGFGRKREMLTAQLQTSSRRTSPAPWFEMKTAPLTPGSNVAIIGAGIAGASLARALGEQGYCPVIYDGAEPASGASGNPAGLIMPRLNVGAAPAGRFHTSAYIHAIRLLLELNDDNIFTPCGVTLHALTEREKERQEKLLARNALPTGWIEPRSEGLHFPQAGVAAPPDLVAALLGDAPFVQRRCDRIEPDGPGWRVIAENNSETFDAVVIAAGLDSLRFAQLRGLPLAGSAGQIDLFPDARAPSCAHAFGPYAAPAPKGGLVIGATYAPITIGSEPHFSPEATQSNLDAVAKTLPDSIAGLAPDQSSPRVSVRCTTPDRLPVAGPVPDWGFYTGAYDGLRDGKRGTYPPGEAQPGLYVLTGLGSRGLVTAPLLAEMIAAHMAGAPAPVDSSAAHALHPARFFIRDLKRAGGKAS